MWSVTGSNSARPFRDHRSFHPDSHGRELNCKPSLPGALAAIQGLAQPQLNDSDHRESALMLGLGKRRPVCGDGGRILAEVGRHCWQSRCPQRPRTVTARAGSRPRRQSHPLQHCRSRVGVVTGAAASGTCVRSAGESAAVWGRLERTGLKGAMAAAAAAKTWRRRRQRSRR